MKNFLVYVFTILTVVVLLNVILGKIVDASLVSGTNTYFEEWNRIANGEINSELIILGSSRGKVSYDPSILDEKLGFSTYNLSFDAAPHNLQIDKYYAYLAYNRRPNILIQNIDIAHFSTLSKIPFREQLLPVAKEFEIKNILKKYDSSFSFWEMTGVVKYSYDSRLFKKAFSYTIDKTSNDEMLDLRGFYPVDKKLALDYLNLQRLEELSSKKEVLDLQGGVNTTLSFVQSEAENGVKIFLTWVPEHRKRLKLTEETSKYLKNQIRTFCYHTPNVDFIDLQNYTLQEEEFFYDTFHLNKKGSFVVSNIIAEEILKFKN